MKLSGPAIASHLFRFQWVYFTLVLMISVAMLWPASQTSVDNSLEIWFPENDPAYVEYLRFQQSFGNDEVVAVAIHNGAGFLSPVGLDHLARVERALSQLAHVHRVTSIADFIPAWKAGLGGTYDSIIDHPAARHRLISDDARSALLLVELEANADIDTLRPQILKGIRQALVNEESFQLAGIGVIYDALNRLAMQDSSVIIGAGYGLILILLALTLRDTWALLATLGAASLTSLWLLGIYRLADRDINMVTMVIPSLLLVIGISMCIHIFHHTHTLNLGSSPNRRQLVTGGLGAMIVPCFFNVTTSGLGFLSLASSSVTVVRDLGLFSAIGLLAVFLVSISLCTLVIGRSKQTAGGRDNKTSALLVTVEGLVKFALRWPRATLIAATAICLLAVLGIGRLVIDTNSLGFIVGDHKVPADSRLIEQRIGPYTPLEWVIRGDKVLSEQNIRAIQRWQDAVLAKDLAGWSHSIGTYIGEADVGKMLPALKQASGNDGWWQMIVKEPDGLRVTFGVPIQSAGEMKRRIQAIGDLAELPDNVTLSASGYLPLYTHMMSLIVDTLISSFTIAFVTVFAVIALLFRSRLLVLLSIPSNLFPVLATLGLMGWTGISLDISTVTIAAIVLGLVVDDTVQFLYRYRAYRRDHATTEALTKTTHSIGYSMAMSTLAIGVGLSVLTLADVKSVVWFGVLIPCTMLFALLADLMMLPALLSLFDRQREYQS